MSGGLNGYVCSFYTARLQRVRLKRLKHIMPRRHGPAGRSVGVLNWKNYRLVGCLYIRYTHLHAVRFYATRAKGFAAFGCRVTRIGAGPGVRGSGSRFA